MMMMDHLISRCLWDLVRRYCTIFHLTLVVAGLIALLVVTAISCGMKNLCKRRDTTQDEETSSLGNSATVSNSLNKDERCIVSKQLYSYSCKTLLTASISFQKLVISKNVLLVTLIFPLGGNFDLQICWQKGFTCCLSVCSKSNQTFG